MFIYAYYCIYLCNNLCAGIKIKFRFYLRQFLRYAASVPSFFFSSSFFIFLFYFINSYQRSFALVMVGSWARNWDFVGQLNEVRTHLARKDPASDTHLQQPRGGNSKRFNPDPAWLPIESRDMSWSVHAHCQVLPVGVYAVTCAPDRCQHPAANGRGASGWTCLTPCLSACCWSRLCKQSLTSPSSPSSSATAAQLIYDHLVLHASQICARISLLGVEGGTNCLLGKVGLSNP